MGKNINRLRVIRADRHFSQLDTAIKAGIKHYRYWRIENGYIDPEPEEKENIATALDVTVAEAFPPQEAVAS